MKRILSLIMASIILLGTISGCSPKTNDNNGTSNPSNSTNGSVKSTKDSVTIGMSATLTALHPPEARDTGSQDILRNVVETLVVIEDGKMLPKLCESFEVAPDNMSATFKLRQNVTFHNGDSVTAKDVAFSYSMMDEFPSYRINYLAFFDSTEIIDDYTVKINTKYPTAQFSIMISSIAILSERAMKEMGDEHKNGAIGTGPYKFVSYDKANNVELTRYDGYWGEKPPIKDVKYRIIPDTNTLMVALESGDVDIVSRVPASSALNLEGNDKFDLKWVPAEGNINIVVNNQKEPFTDYRVRQALSYAVDREALNMIAAEGKNIPSDYFYTTAMVAAPDPATIKHYAYDVEKAKQLLTEAGFPNGLKLTQPMVIKQSEEKIAVALQQQLKKAGIEFEVELLEQNALFETMRGNTYLLSTFGFSQELKDMYYPGMQIRQPVVAGGISIVNYRNAELDKKWDAASAEGDVEKRRVMYKEIFDIMQEEMPIIPLMEKQEATIKTKDLTINKQLGPIISAFNLSW